MNAKGIFVTIQGIYAKAGSDGTIRYSLHCVESHKKPGTNPAEYETVNAFFATVSNKLVPKLMAMPAFQVMGQLNPNDPNYSSYKFPSGQGAPKKPLLVADFFLNGMGQKYQDQNGQEMTRNVPFISMTDANPYQSQNGQGQNQNQAQGGFTPAPAPNAQQGGFGAPNAAPAQGGFGAPNAAPAQGGFGGGFAAPNAAPAQSGFGGGFGAPNAAPQNQPMNPPQDGFGGNPMFDAAPAPTVQPAQGGFGGAAPTAAPAQNGFAPVQGPNPFDQFNQAANQAPGFQIQQ